MPARLYHKLAFGADGAPGPSRTLVISRARDERSDPERAAEVRFMRFFDHTPMAIATVDRGGNVVRANARYAKLAQGAQRRRRRGEVDLPRRQRARPRHPDCGDQPGRRRAGRHRAGRGDAGRRQGALGPVLRHLRRAGRARRPRPRSSTCWRPPSGARWRTRSTSRRRWRWSASSPAASRTTSTTCCPPS